MTLIWFLLIGLVAGWLAGQIWKGGGFGLIGDLILGVLGAYFGGWLLPRLGIVLGGDFGVLITATIGALLLLVIVRLINRV
jgi:uncharacterized membrane protein YeaQ/YmgE (transglycosylase-associated protein family)